MKPIFRIRYDIETRTDISGVIFKVVTVRSRLGSPCRREWQICRVPARSPRLAQFVERVESMRSERLLTVRERARLLSTVWSECQG